MSHPVSDKPPSDKQRIRLFQNDFLERLTLISPRMFAAVWALLLPVIVWAGWGAVSVSVGAALFAAGLIFWSLFEYGMHRYIFHFETDIKPIKWAVFLMHGNHHDCPNDPLRNLMPLSVSLPVLALIWALCNAAMGAAGLWAFLGFTMGYIAYDTVHYACHQWDRHWIMRTQMGMALRRHHMRHHHVDGDRNFAISTIFWDRVFGTRITSLKPAGPKPANAHNFRAEDHSDAVV